MKRTALLFALALAAVPSLALAGTGTIHHNQYTILDLTDSLTGTFTIAAGGTILNATANASGPSIGGTISLTGPASCSATRGRSSVTCSISSPPAGTYSVTYAPFGTANKTEIIVDFVP